MLKNKKTDLICLLALILALAVAALFLHGEALGLKRASAAPGYVSRLFDPGQVHQIDIIIDDWEGFLATAAEENYTPCGLLVDGEPFTQVGLRAKGNNSLRLTEKYGLDRYSLKLEFDHYGPGSYHGLDKLSLDASFQDNSYLKTWLALDMMAYMGVPRPLCSYAWVTVNGQPWGLFLAVEEPEEAFARRNFGHNYGQLYKPDYKSLNDDNIDLALGYIDDDPASYDNIFRNAKFNTTKADRQRLIEAIKTLNSGDNLEQAVDIDQVLRYFTVQVFVVNLDSYLGRTGHNYYLYEQDGRLAILPWDYNLAFATYSLGMPEPINDAKLYINYPIDTPAAGEIMLRRPLYHQLMLDADNFALYHDYFDRLISGYFESGLFEQRIGQMAALIAPYVEDDPTAFCSYPDHRLAAETLTRFCRLRAESVRGQLAGEIPSTIRGQLADKSGFIEAEGVSLPDLGEIADLQD